MKYFYNDVIDDDFEDDEDDDIFEGDGTLDDILHSFYDLSEEDGSFLGLENEQETVIQFMWESDSEWLVDIPDIEKEGSWQKHADYDECILLIEKFFNNNQIDMTCFVFQSFKDD